MDRAYTISKVEHEMFASAREQAVAMEGFLRSSEAMAATHSELEKRVARDGREYERLLLQAHLELRAASEKVVAVCGADGVQRTTRRHSQRSLRTVFGVVQVPRLAYQAPEVAGLHPMDAALNLPDELYSHGVRRCAAEHLARCSYEEVVSLVSDKTGAPVHRRQLEELAIRAAQDFESFYANRTVEAEATNDLLVLSFDAKGIAMRHEDLRPATRKAAASATPKLETRLTKGEKRNRKRMAEVSAIYTVAPFPRKPMDVLHDLRPVHAVPLRRPRPVNKRVWASVVQDTKQVIRQTFEEALRRDPERRRRWVVLVDGNKDQIAIIRATAREFGVIVTLVLDLIHVLEYLWKASYCFHADGSKEAERWVEQRLLGLLDGHSAGRLAKGMRRNAAARGLTPEARKAVDDCARYLVNNRNLLHYDRIARRAAHRHGSH
jgi:hypothetical protein